MARRSSHSKISKGNSHAVQRQDCVQGAPPMGSPPRSSQASDTLAKQRQEISHLNRGLRDQSDHVKRLKEQLSRSTSCASETLDDLKRKQVELDDVTRDLQKKKALVEDLSVSKAQCDKDLEDLTRIMDVGREVLAQKNDENKRLQEEVQLMRTNLADREATIATLRENVLRLTMASPDQFAAAALDAQAQQALVIINGLRQEDARKDVLVARYEKEIAALSQTDEQEEEGTMKAQKTIDELQISLEMANGRAYEAQSVLDSQSKLIKRLMEENARLSA